MNKAIMGTYMLTRTMRPLGKEKNITLCDMRTSVRLCYSVKWIGTITQCMLKVILYSYFILKKMKERITDS